MTTFLSLKEINKRYPKGVQALKNVSLDIPQGSLTAIMGPSGSGKSTLMNILGCLDRPTSGHYLLQGQDISKLSDNQLSHIRSQKIGFVFQSYNLIPQLSVFENVALPFQYRPRPKDWQNHILNAVSLVRLDKRLYHKPSELSGGEMQRVAIARALAISPAFILADEPTGNLDSETGEAILQLFQELHEKGTTCLIVTHDEKVGRRCPHLIKMLDGEVIKHV